MKPVQVLVALVPLAVAVAAAALLEFSRFAGAALTGAGLALTLVLAGGRITLRFAALGFGAALAFGLMAMLLAELVGLPVRQLLDEGAWSAQPVAIALAWLAVMFAGLALVSAAWAMWRGVPEPDLPDDEPPRR